MFEYIVELLSILVSITGVEQLKMVAQNDTLFGIDMSIESLRSREFSVYIFIFLILSLILFCYIIYLYLPKKLNQLKTGEKIMFGALVMGVVLAVIMGYVQLIEGFLL